MPKYSSELNVLSLWESLTIEKLESIFGYRFVETENERLLKDRNSPFRLKVVYYSCCPYSIHGAFAGPCVFLNSGLWNNLVGFRLFLLVDEYKILYKTNSTIDFENVNLNVRYVYPRIAGALNFSLALPLLNLPDSDQIFDDMFVHTSYHQRIETLMKAEELRALAISNWKKGFGTKKTVKAIGNLYYGV